MKRPALNRLAAKVCSALRGQGIDVILTGGSCVAIYSEGKYVTGDLDFVPLNTHDMARIESALATVGFKPQGRVYVNPDEELVVDIVRPPLAIGSEPVRTAATIKAGRYSLKLLTPTDCVKDRLAAFYFWNDRRGLEQAMLVCLAQKVSATAIGRWSRAEGMADRYREFQAALSTRRRRARSKPV